MAADVEADEEPARVFEFKPADAPVVKEQVAKSRLRILRHRYILGFAFGTVTMVDVVIHNTEEENGKTCKVNFSP